MQFLVMSLFVAVFAAEYLTKELAVVHPYFALVPEALSAVAMLLVLKGLMFGGRWAIDRRYGLFLALYLFIVAFGFLAQAVPSGAMVAGLRNYLKFIPFFLLPLVYPFSARQLGAQLALLMTLLLVQSPFAVYQRFVQFGDGLHTGDRIKGFTTSSGALSMLMLCAIVVIVSMYLRKKISFALMLVAVGVLFLPTTLNETKITLILLPIALLLPALYMPPGSRSLRKLVPVAVVGTLAALMFVGTYDYFIQNSKYGSPIGTFFAEGEARGYLYTGAADGVDRYIGRFDSIVIAVRRLAEDPLALAFGLGAGNVSASMAAGFDGQYSSYFERFGVGLTQVTTFVWEIGLIGLAIYLVFYWLVWRDARSLARETGAWGLLGQSWATIAIIMAVGLLYVTVFTINEIAYFFWFYSGVVAGAAVRLREAKRREARRRVDAPNLATSYG